MASTVRSLILAEGPADAIHSGGAIVAVDPIGSTAEAVAVLGGKVVARRS